MFFFIMIFTMNGCRHEILFSSFFLKTPDFPLCLCFNIMEPANPVFWQQMAKKNLDLKNICGKILVLLHLFKGNQVFKFETEYKINVYFLIFIALPIVHCFRHYWGVIGPQSGSKWPKYHFVAMSQSCGSKLVEQGWNKSKHTQAMSWNHFSGHECSLGGPITPKMSQKELKGAITDHKRPF